MNLRVITDQWTDDTNNSGNNPNPPKDYSDEFLINKDIGIHCSEIMATARIKGEGKVGLVSAFRKGTIQSILTRLTPPTFSMVVDKTTNGS